MMKQLKILYNNLSKAQRVGILVGVQIIVIIIFAAVINASFGDRSHVDLIDENGLSNNIPNDEKQFLKDSLWLHISNIVDDVNKSVLDDVIIRDGTYEEVFDEDVDITTASFLVDIDSLKQTYSVSIQWSDKETLPDGIDIECPPISQMKYKETFCQGMYNNTNSFDLYFPYYAYKEGVYDDDDSEEYCDDEECYDDSEYDSGLLYMIDGDEDEKTIYIESSICDVDKYNQEALNYIKDNTPFYNNPEYKIEYSVNEVDVICD